MARKRMVTRTVKMTIAQVKVVDAISEKMMTMEFKLPYVYKDEKAVIKKVESLISNPDIKVLKVLDTEVLEDLYGMPEEEFIRVAKPMAKEEAQEEV